MTTQTLLLRQVNPSWVQAGRVTSQAFKPTQKDNKMLSVYDGDQIEPEASWRHYTEQLGHLSVGVLAVIVAECQS
jgi:tRNA(Ile2) C34 agmatinyltransferase TiaS